MVQKYRKKPVEVEAVRWGIPGAPSRPCPIEGWIADGGGQAKYGHEDGEGIYVETLEGVMKASPGDYIIKGVNGEFYPCKPDIFAKTYEPVIEPLAA